MTVANPEDVYSRLLSFIADLRRAGISHRFTSVRDDAVMVEIAVPGQRWEVEFLADGSVDVEKFLSDGHMFDQTELRRLFEEFTD